MSTKVISRMSALPLLMTAACSSVGTAITGEGGDPSDLCRIAIVRAERDQGIPIGLLHAVGRVEAGRQNPDGGQPTVWPWSVSADGRRMFFQTREGAMSEIERLRQRNIQDIRVGCFQVRLGDGPQELSADRAFDPRGTTDQTARRLGELRTSHQSWEGGVGFFRGAVARTADAYRARVMSVWPEAPQQTSVVGSAPAPAAALQTAAPTVPSLPGSAMPANAAFPFPFPAGALAALTPGGNGGMPPGMAGLPPGIAASGTNGQSPDAFVPPSGRSNRARDQGRDLDGYRGAPIMQVGRAPRANLTPGQGLGLFRTPGLPMPNLMPRAPAQPGDVMAIPTPQNGGP